MAKVTLKSTIIKAEEPTLNGHFYTLETCQRIADSINEGNTDVVDTPLIQSTTEFFKPGADRSTIGKAIKAELVDGAVVVEFEVDESVLREGSIFTPSGIGTFTKRDEKPYVEDYSYAFIQHSVKDGDVAQ